MKTKTSNHSLVHHKGFFWAVQAILFLSLLAASVYDLGRLAHPDYLKGKYDFPSSTRLLRADTAIQPEALAKLEDLDEILVFAVGSNQAAVYDPADQLLKRSFSMTINGEPLYFRPNDYKEKKKKTVLVADSYE